VLVDVARAVALEHDTKLYCNVDIFFGPHFLLLPEASSEDVLPANSL
jgi:hypothetical protein